MSTDFQRVHQWRESIGQDVPDNVFDITEGTVDTQKELIREEVDECLEALEAADDEVQIAKELADVIVVVQGMFSARGIDGDEVMKVVHDNNDKKVQNGYFNDSGKLVVDTDTKKLLKKEAHTRLREIIYGTA